MKCMVHLLTTQMVVHVPLAELQHDQHDSHSCKYLVSLNNLITRQSVDSVCVDAMHLNSIISTH